MSKIRVYELAKQLGVTVEVVTERCIELGLRVDGHLTQLDGPEVAALKRAFAQKPAGEVTQKRVKSTVIRRRRRADKGTPAPTPAPTPDPAPAAEPTSAPEVAAQAPEPEAPAPASEPEGSVDTAPAVAEEAAGTDKSETQQAAEAAPSTDEATDVEPASPEAAAPDSKPVETAQTDAAKAKEESTRTDTQYGAESAVNAPGRQAPEDRRALAQVVRQLDPSLKASLMDQVQRKAERSSRPRGGDGPRPAGRPSMPMPGMMDPGAAGPGRADTRKKSKKRTAGGRVAYDRNKDRHMDHTGRRRPKRNKRRPGTGQQTERTVPKASKRVIKMEETITVGQLANEIAVKASEVIRVLMDAGEMVTVNHVLDMDTVSLIASEFGFTVENVAFDLEKFIPSMDDENVEAKPRDPIVTVMGHVDHGKTSLLDAIRQTRVAAGESGGITQHIGAYKVPVGLAEGDRSLVFLDTPGHAAFTQMRARGAQVTDIVILVVAADDGVMPQTIEAVNHSKAAEVPIVVAVNKMDKPEANPERVRQELTEHEVVTEEWGGDVQFINISAHTGEGIDALLEAVALQADLLELKAVSEGQARGVVIEAELSKGRGPVATVLVQQGTLKRGDIVVAGKATGRVRALVDDRGRTVQSAGPATPVEVLGLNQVPPPSETFFAVKEERDARQIVSHIDEKDRNKRLAEERKRVTLDDLFDHMAAGDVKQLGLVIKSDVQGSLEALKHSFSKIKHPEIEVRVIHSGVGAISESDVSLASASEAIIIGFNVRPEKNAKLLAEQEGVDIRLYSVIYSAIDDVKAALEGMLDPLIEERAVGKASILQSFHIPKVGTIAGCAVLQGKIIRDGKARLVRDGIVIYEGTVDTLRRFKDDVKEVDRGHECGIHLKNYNDVKVGDEIECFEIIEIAQKLKLDELG